MAKNEKTKYNYMENTLHRINERHIVLTELEQRRNKRILNEILVPIILEMTDKDQLFKSMYSTIFYGGSYYDGLKVGHPDEFDIDLLLSLPKFAKPTLTSSEIPGFVKIQLQALQRFLNQPEAHSFKCIGNLLDSDDFLLTTKVLAWMESLVNKILNTYPRNGNSILFKGQYGDFQGKLVKSGPALTLKLEGYIDDSKVIVDIDIVPCFVFSKDYWLPSPYIQPNHGNKSKFLIVPKAPQWHINSKGRYWRLSFQEQERAMMNDLRTLKPSLKLLKLLRDYENYPIPSYYIKTIFLLEVANNKSLFTDSSLSHTFMMMLNIFQMKMHHQCIPYFWNNEYNLLREPSIKWHNISNRLLRIIDDIEKNLNNPTTIEKYLGNPRKAKLVMEEVVPPTKDDWSCAIL